MDPMAGMDVEEEFGAIGGGYAGRNRSPPPQ
jgi:hypothetical protein